MKRLLLALAVMTATLLTKGGSYTVPPGWKEVHCSDAIVPSIPIGCQGDDDCNFYEKCCFFNEKNVCTMALEPDENTINDFMTRIESTNGM